MCLVIMPFSKEFKEIYEYGIKPAVIEAGYHCVRVDELMGQINITKAIIRSIFNADVIIADLTGNNANVFYELGVAHAISNKTIMLTQDIHNAPFDVKSYRIILYEQTLEGASFLKEKLTNEIQNFDAWKTSSTNPVQDFGKDIFDSDPYHKIFNRGTSPVVVKTIPVSGDTNVDPNLAELHVTFNKKMMPRCWSWCSISEHSYPETVESPYFLKGNKTCVLKVKLESEKRYAIWINIPPKYLGFRDLDNNPAVPFLLTFVTRK